MRLGWSALLVVVLAPGCAHHRADQYAFAPPYAPPVYPQPASYSQPAGGGALPPGAPPPVIAGAMPPAGVAGTTPCPPAGTVQAAHGSPCPEGEWIVPGSMTGGEMPAGGIVMAEGQTPPCPPGP